MLREIALLITFCHMMQFKWNLAANEEFCFEENLPEKILVNGYAEGGNNATIDLKIISPKNENLFKEELKTFIRFSFATFDAGNHKFCLVNMMPYPQKATFKLDIGIQAKNYTSFTSKPDLSELDFDVKKLEDMTNQLHSDLIFLYQKASVITNVNEGTSSKIIFFGILTVALLMISTIIQIWSIRKFFIQKKIA